MNTVLRNWCGIHVFLADSDKATDFLCECFAPMVRTMEKTGKIQGWFFLRYWEGGPHLRLRFLGLDQAQRKSIIINLRKEISRWQSNMELNKETYYLNHPFDGAPVDVATLPWHPEGSVEMIDYLPELQRYGGMHAIAVNEALFQVTSKIAISVLAATRNAIEHRLSMAFILMAHFVFAIDPSPGAITSFYRNYAKFWMNYSKDTKAYAEELYVERNNERQRQTLQRLLILRNDKTQKRTVQSVLEGAVLNWTVKLRKLHELGLLMNPATGNSTKGTFADNSIWAMLVSHVHMSNNRLGLTPTQEVILAMTLVDAAEQLDDNYREKDR